MRKDSIEIREPQERAIKVGDWVQALEDILDPLPGEDGRRIRQAKRGSIGHVIDLRPGFFPTIYWESTGAVSDCIPGCEFKRLGGADTGKYPYNEGAPSGRH